MSAPNYYPELPVVPVKSTTVNRQLVINYLQQLNEPVAVKRAAYFFFAQEAGHGTKGINNNYAGVQADSGRWGSPWDAVFAATTVAKENGTSKTRRFVVFDTWQKSIDFLVERVKKRGLYIGGFANPRVNMPIATVNDFVRAYYKEWVTGNAKAEPSATQFSNLTSVYNSAAKLFLDVVVATPPKPVAPVVISKPVSKPWYQQIIDKWF